MVQELLEDRYRFSFNIQVLNDLFVISSACESNVFEGTQLIKLFSNSLPHTIIFNTCGVTHLYTEITKKYLRRLKEVYPDYTIYITGCGSSYYPEIYKEFGIIIKDEDKFNPKSYGLESTIPTSINCYLPKIRIQNGCSHQCTYCITRLVKGKSISCSYSFIYESINKIIQNGWDTVVLSGINLTEYYSDNMYLTDLCKRILKDFPTIKIKTTNLDPAAPETLKIIELMKEEPRLVQQLHLPIQSGNDEILSLMKRRHTVKDIENIYNLLKNTNISTYWDIIVAFPGETEDQFQDTCNLIKKYKPTFSLVLPCCLHKGTEAYNLPNQISEEEGLRRTKIARQLVDENINHINSNLEYNITNENLNHILILLSDRETIISQNVIKLNFSNFYNENTDIVYLLGELLYCRIIENLEIVFSKDTNRKFLDFMIKWFKNIQVNEKVKFNLNEL